MSRTNEIGTEVLAEVLGKLGKLIETIAKEKAVNIIDVERATSRGSYSKFNSNEKWRYIFKADGQIVSGVEILAITDVKRQDVEELNIDVKIRSRLLGVEEIKELRLGD